MSESVFPALKIQPYDPYTPLANLAKIGEANATTQGQQITNQGNQLGLLLQRARLAPFLNGTTEPIGSGSALGALAAPGMGGGTPVPMPQAGSQSPPTQTAAPAQPSLPGDIGEQIYGVAMPPMTAMSLAGDKDPTGSLAKIADTRRQILYSAAANADSPQAWDQAVTGLAQQGWLSSKSAQGLLGRYDLQPRVLQAMASPDANSKLTGELAGQGLQMGPTGAMQPNPGAIAGAGLKAQATSTGSKIAEAQYAGPIAQATASGTDAGHLVSGPSLAYQMAFEKARAETPFGKPIEFDVPRPEGGSDHYVLPPGAYAPGGPMAGGAAPQRAGDLANPNAPITPAAYASRVNGAENAGGAPNARNPNSSATGNTQFTDNTWLQTVRQARPDLAGQSDQAILAMRSDPGMSAEMSVAYARQNAPVLAQAGLPVNSATLGMAHRFGAQGAVAVMNAPPNAPMPSLVSPDVIKANPELANQTAGTVVRTMVGKYGTAPVQLGGGVMPASAPATGPAPPAGPGAASPPSATPGVMIGTTQAPAALKQQESDIGAMAEYRKDLLAKSQAATQNNAVLQQMQNEAQNFQMGWGAETAGDARAILDSLAKNLGVPESSSFTSQVGSQQAFMKNAGELARTAAHGLSARVGVQELQMIQKQLPTDEMSPQAFRMIGAQLGGLNDYEVAKSAASATATGNPNAFEAQWNANVSPAAFVVHRMSSEDLAALHAKLMQTADGKQTWQNLRNQVAYAESKNLFDGLH